MSDIEEDDQIEPMHPAARKFLEVVFQDVAVEGCTRHLEFLDEPDGSTSVLLVAPEQLGMPAIALGFPAGWFPPGSEEWDESLIPESEELARDISEKYEEALAHENDLSPEEIEAECAVIHPDRAH